MAQTDFSQNAGGGSANNFNATSWSNARAGIGGTTNYTDDGYTLRSDLSGRFIQRCFFVFDTSALTALATITAAELRVYRNDTLEAFANPNSCDMIIVPQNQTDPVELGTAGDYTTVTFTNRGEITFASTTNNTYSAITITDFSEISKTSYTKYALVTDRDFDNVEPTGTNKIAFDAFGGSNPPILRVTYSLPGGGTNVMFFSTGGVTVG